MAAEGMIALCADDYGLSHGVSVGILQALEAGRLTAVSAMVNMPRWPAMGRELQRRIADKGLDADIGLHLNFTLGRPLGPMPQFAPGGNFPSVGAVIRLALRRGLPLEEIRAEIDRQIDRFEAIMGRAPDHIDGHQHVHVLPGLRGVMLQALVERRLLGRVWLRDAGDRVDRIARRGAQMRKALAVRGLGATFAREAVYRGFAVNEGFAGFSDFHPGHDYARAFETYLHAPGGRHLIMCHPGHVDDELKTLDPVTTTRAQELAFLLSPKLPEMLEKRGLRLQRLSRFMNIAAAG